MREREGRGGEREGRGKGGEKEGEGKGRVGRGKWSEGIQDVQMRCRAHQNTQVTPCATCCQPVLNSPLLAGLPVSGSLPGLCTQRHQHDTHTFHYCPTAKLQQFNDSHLQPTCEAAEYTTLALFQV